MNFADLSPEDFAKIAQSFAQMGNNVQGPAIQNIQRGGGILPMMPSTFEGPKTAEDFASILSNLLKENEDMVGLLDFFKK